MLEATLEISYLLLESLLVAIVKVHEGGMAVGGEWGAWTDACDAGKLDTTAANLRHAAIIHCEESKTCQFRNSDSGLPVGHSLDLDMTGKK